MKEESIEVEFVKGNRGLGFVLAECIDIYYVLPVLVHCRHNIRGDNEIHVTKVLDRGEAAAYEGIPGGDKLVAIKGLPDGDFALDKHTHEEAVNALRNKLDEYIWHTPICVYIFKI